MHILFNIQYEINNFKYLSFTDTWFIQQQSVTQTT